MRVSEMVVSVLNNQRMQGQISRISNTADSSSQINPFEDPYMDVTGKSAAERKKIIPVDEKVVDELKAVVREDFMLRYGMSGDGKQADKSPSIIKEYISTLPGEDRLAASYTCTRIQREEAQRLAAIVRESNPDWQYGEYFDTGILENAGMLDITV